MIKVSLTSGPSREFPEGLTAARAMTDLGVTGDRQVVAARVDGALVDLASPLTHDCTLAPVGLDTPEGLEIMRHSASHLMAEAVRQLFPDAKVAIGPAIENGFYYVFDVKEPFTPDL